MTAVKDIRLGVDLDVTGSTPEKTQEMRDQLGQLLFERACEIIRDNKILSLALHTAVLEEVEPAHRANQLAESIIADDAQAVGRLIIDQVINATWAMAERELGLSVSENPEGPCFKIDKTH